MLATSDHVSDGKVFRAPIASQYASTEEGPYVRPSDADP
jgi:hypothetical protein